MKKLDVKITRYHKNPVLSAKDVPYHANLVFNAGAIKYQGRYVMVFRNDYGDETKKQLQGTNLGLAFSDNGLEWQVEPEPCFDLADEDIICVNDPRLIEIKGQCYMTVAVITKHGVRGGIFSTTDFKHFETVYMSLPDNRNFVLFPEKIKGKYVRLERPFSWYKGGDERFDIWLSESEDLKCWGNHRLVLGVEQVPYANNRIGPGTPPIKTNHGWLMIFHAVFRHRGSAFNGWEGNWNKEYMAGALLLDLDDPAKIIGMSRQPILKPNAEFKYEAEGFRGNVIFPGGIIVEPDGKVKIYYGAADTVEALALTHLNDLLELCEPVSFGQ